MSEEEYESMRPACKQFFNEILSVFIRWYEESDLDDEEMAQAASYAVDRFFDLEVAFEADFDLDDDDEVEEDGEFL
jgi:hypothetical protein